MNLNALAAIAASRTPVEPGDRDAVQALVAATLEAAGIVTQQVEITQSLNDGPGLRVATDGGGVTTHGRVTVTGVEVRGESSCAELGPRHARLFNALMAVRQRLLADRDTKAAWLRLAGHEAAEALSRAADDARYVQLAASEALAQLRATQARADGDDRRAGVYEALARAGWHGTPEALDDAAGALLADPDVPS